MSLTNFIRGIVRKHPELKLKIKKADSNLTTFQYTYQSVFMTGFSLTVLAIIISIALWEKWIFLIFGIVFLVILTPFIFGFWFSYIDVQIRKYARELDADLLFVSEYFLVSLESGMPLGNSIQELAKIDRPGGKFFKKVYSEFRTGKDLENSLQSASDYAPSDNLKILLKKLKDSLSIGVDLTEVLENFIKESSEKKIIEIRAFSKKLNPVIMMYLLLGIVLPSLGVTFLILAITLLPDYQHLMKYILILILMVMFLFQYLSYSAFKFGKSTI